jgi:hypothetical protein
MAQARKEESRPADEASAPEAAPLFTPRETPTSPMQWLERLREVARLEQEQSEGGNAAPAAAPPPVRGAAPAAPPRAEEIRGATPSAPAPRKPAIDAAIPIGSASPPDAPGPSEAQVHPPAALGPLVQRALAVAPVEPVSDAARVFLAPLVGVDLSTARVRSGPEVEEATRARGADALAVGDDILLPQGEQGTSPESLGLLAHELTHVARRREPHFIPPVLQAPPAAADLLRAAGGAPRPGDAPVMAAATLPSPRVPTRATEEGIARGTERAVRRTARESPAEGPPPAAATRAFVPPLGVPASGEEPGAVRPPRNPIWGDLPAPWEPLPTDGPAAPPFSGLPRAPVATAPAPVWQPTAARSMPPVEPVHAAESDRDSDGDDTDARPAHQDGNEASGGNIDVLARKVYSVLRRRLAAERRRGLV